jgi:hypothetical protein
MPPYNQQPAPNYTTAALTMLWVNLMWIFGVIWALWGLVPVMLLGLVFNHFINRLAALRG